MTSPAATPTLSVMSTLAVKGALVDTILPAFLARTGVRAEVLFEPTNVLNQRIEQGERAALIIAIASHVDAHAQKGLLEAGHARLIARTGVGLAVAKGAPLPALDTVDDLKRCLLNARSVAYSRTGASGVYFAGLLERLGIADAVNARATVIHKGFTAERIVAGIADVAIQQLSELAVVEEVTIAGPFPADVQTYTVFKAAPFAGFGAQPAVQQLLDAITSDAARAAYQQAGLEHIDPQIE